MDEKRILLNESTFTNLCKMGFLKDGNIQLNFTSNEIATLCKGEILEKTYNDWSGNIIFKFALQDIGFEIINEILKRSPIFSDLTGNFLNK
jgi:hypothetical protein